MDITPVTPSCWKIWTVERSYDLFLQIRSSLLLYSKWREIPAARDNTELERTRKPHPISNNIPTILPILKLIDHNLQNQLDARSEGVAWIFPVEQQFSRLSDDHVTEVLFPYTVEATLYMVRLKTNTLDLRRRGKLPASKAVAGEFCKTFFWLL